MKKTSLVLAISALLYGASSTYTFAIDLDTILSQIDTQIANEPAEDAIPPDGSTGTDPFTLPPNVTVNNDNPIYKERMCDTSFQVTGEVMAQFPVTVSFANDRPSETVMWNSFGIYGYALGTNSDWLLVQTGDTWYTSNPWMLFTDENVSVTQIRLEPINRKGLKKYAFDIGGKDLLTKGAPEHTPDAANGRPIMRKQPPSPKVAFTAEYSNPVYTKDHNDDGTHSDLDSPHDLYGTLTINFNNPVSGTEALGYIGFAYIADTDCLPVQEVNNISYVGTTLSFTVVGEGAVAIMNAQKLVQGPFMVERGTGQATFTTQFVPTAGSCYNMMDVDTLKVMTKDYCF